MLTRTGGWRSCIIHLNNNQWTTGSEGESTRLLRKDCNNAVWCGNLFAGEINFISIEEPLHGWAARTSPNGYLPNPHVVSWARLIAHADFESIGHSHATFNVTVWIYRFGGKRLKAFVLHIYRRTTSTELVNNHLSTFAYKLRQEIGKIRASGFRLNHRCWCFAVA